MYGSRLPIFVLLLLAFGMASAAPSLTEREAVRLGLQHPKATALWEANTDIAKGRVESAGRWANPEVEYTREALELPAGETEENTWSIRQRINLAGVPRLTRKAARHQHRATDLRNDHARREWAADIRQRFYEALAARREAGLIADWHRRLTELTNAIEQRVAAGDASHYDLTRLKQELALLEGERLNTRAKAASARDRLAQRTGDEQRPLTGRLLPPPYNAPGISSAATQSPLLQALSAETESAEVRARAAERQRWPEVTLGVGRKEVVEPGFQADGNVLSIGIEIPLFDRHSGQARTQRGRAQQQRADLALARAEFTTRLRALQRNLVAERASALALLDSLKAPPESLSEVAESGYAAGELNVAELIDAHRSELNARRALIQRELEARGTFIQLKLLTGD
ncbi:TolC family protein [Marinimicrobium locisalis]|uniref:TolC family protein n=1 Tax=Marinimicrobium locisalis TaxID=546022 RepID=UPI0032218404